MHRSVHNMVVMTLIVYMDHLNNEEKTKEAIDDEGWLHSGDIGRMDAVAYLELLRYQGTHALS